MKHYIIYYTSDWTKKCFFLSSGVFINQHGNLVAWVGQGDGLRLVAAAQGQVVKICTIQKCKISIHYTVADYKIHH